MLFSLNNIAEEKRERIPYSFNYTPTIFSSDYKNTEPITTVTNDNPKSMLMYHLI